MNPMYSTPLIAMLTDFGYQDPFVGILKGVIAKLSLGARVVDISHSVPQGDIQRAAIQLWMTRNYFPHGTIFLSVVDPGVGTDRKAIIIVEDHYTFIGPDNGLFTFVSGEECSAWELSERRYQLAGQSSTFHGRDIFAPAAAYAANGVPAEEFGPRVRETVRLKKPSLEIEGSLMRGEIIYHDQFGNLLTSLGEFQESGPQRYELFPWLPNDESSASKKEISSHQASLQLPNGDVLPWVSTFAQIPEGDCAVLVGSTGLLEIAANNQSARELTGLARGAPVTLHYY